MSDYDKHQRLLRTKNQVLGYIAKYGVKETKIILYQFTDFTTYQKDIIWEMAMGDKNDY